MPNPLRRHIPLLLFAAAGLILFFIYSYSPMLKGEDPEAVSHRVDRRGAEQAALQFVKERLPESGELRAFGVYAVERDAFGYLYREKAVDPVSENYKSGLPLELYRVEVAEPSTEVRHTVDVNPYTGKAVEWSLSAEGEPVSERELIEASNKLLAAEGLSAAAELVSADEETGEAVYDLHIPELKDAAVQVTVQADSRGVRSVQSRWETPESYDRLIIRQDRISAVLGLIGQGLSIALQIAAFIYAIRLNKSVSWRRGIVMSVLFALLYCLNNINMYPGIKAMVLGIGDGGDFLPGAGVGAGAGAEDAENQSLINQIGILSGLIVVNGFILLSAAGLYFCFIAGEAMCRRRGLHVWPADSDSGYGGHIVGSMWKGYAFAFGFLGLQSLIYLGAEKSFGTWYTIDSSTSPLNLLYPLLMPLLAWCAAISEEGVYRLFGIPALKAIFRFTAPAVLVSSMIWALMHVQYPIYPYYTRFVEVTLIGLLFSYVFLKHGIMAAIFAHAVADTIWMGISITANQPSAAAWGLFAAYFALPIVIAYAVNAFHKRRRPIAVPLQ
ncbi:CPBP family intramembrane glutamic endopeptidase [Paenibacillus thermotolerans]|uniref:CPBP family intramembrane glutamic endopeptidase n=1 Tax=Paenibacillus thermotolerans TaxID=3027807 RepID=UPI002367B9CC|nr:MULTISPECIES: CPBP family intramembrane glutamic endopeptidase [unclassified Paenibacillus]